MWDTAVSSPYSDPLHLGGEPIGLEAFGPRTHDQGPIARRRRAAESGHAGDESTSRTLLADPDPAVRATALGALARAGKVQSEDVSAAAGDPDPTVRRRAAEVLARADDDLSAASLGPLLTDAEPEVVEAAAWAAGERADPTAVDALARVAADHADPRCREAAVAALGAIGRPDGLPAVLAAIDDRVTVRRRAVLALAPFDGPEVAEALRRALDDRDWQVRQAAEDLLEDRG